MTAKEHVYIFFFWLSERDTITLLQSNVENVKEYYQVEVDGLFRRIEVLLIFIDYT